MREFEWEIRDEYGIHARPAGMLVKEASKFSSEIKIIKEEKESDCKKLFGIMGLGIKCDDKIRIEINGEDEELAERTLKKFFEVNM